MVGLQALDEDVDVRLRVVHEQDAAIGEFFHADGSVRARLLARFQERLRVAEGVILHVLFETAAKSSSAKSEAQRRAVALR